MKTRLRLLCDVFAEEKHEMDITFPMTAEEIDAVCADILMTRGFAPDRDALHRCRSLLFAGTDMFSGLRGVMRAPVCCLMYTSDYPAVMLSRLIYVHSVLKRYFADSRYLVYAASVLSEYPDTMTEGLASRAKHIYDVMESLHAELTAYEDQVFSVLFAASCRSAADLVSEAEYIYERLCMDDSNTIQSAAHILTLADGQPDNKCRLFTDIYNGLLQEGLDCSVYGSLLMIAALASACRSADEAVGDIIDAYSFLGTKKNYNAGLINENGTRLVHAQMLTAVSYAPAGRDLSGTLPVTAAEYALLYMYEYMHDLMS